MKFVRRFVKAQGLCTYVGEIGNKFVRRFQWHKQTYIHSFLII